VLQAPYILWWATSQSVPRAPLERVTIIQLGHQVGNRMVKIPSLPMPTSALDQHALSRQPAWNVAHFTAALDTVHAVNLEQSPRPASATVSFHGSGCVAAPELSCRQGAQASAPALERHSHQLWQLLLTRCLPLCFHHLHPLHSSCLHPSLTGPRRPGRALCIWCTRYPAPSHGTHAHTSSRHNKCETKVPVDNAVYDPSSTTRKRVARAQNTPSFRRRSGTCLQGQFAECVTAKVPCLEPWPTHAQQTALVSAMLATL